MGRSSWTEQEHAGQRRSLNQETNTLYLNHEKLTRENLPSAIIHEAGHFAEKFYLGKEFTKGEWESLTDAQRQAAFKGYSGQEPTFNETLGLKADEHARAEWVAMQFARVVRGETEGMGAKLKEGLTEFLEAIRAVVKRWIGDPKLTTEALDRKIVEMLGYNKETVGAVSPKEPVSPPSETAPEEPWTSGAAQPLGAPKEEENVEERGLPAVENKPQPVPGQKGRFYRSLPDTERETNAKIVRQVYDRRPQEPDLEAADAIIAQHGPERAMGISMSKADDGVPLPVKSAIYVRSVEAADKRFFDAKDPKERAQALRDRQALSTGRLRQRPSRANRSPCTRNSSVT